MNLSPLFISLKTGFLATAITFVLGIYAARFVLKLRRFKGLIDGLFTLPLVLPPTVVGFFLLLIFGKNSLVGKFLLQFEVSLVFSWTSTVIASSVVAFPLMYRTARGAFEQIDPNLIHVGKTLGMSNRKIFWRVMMPIAWPGVAGGAILAFARAIGEFGATIMIAGNIKGKTQTMAVAVYSAVQAGDRVTAYRWVLIIVAISFTVIFLMNFWSDYQNRLIQKRMSKKQ